MLVQRLSVGQVERTDYHPTWRRDRHHWRQHCAFHRMQQGAPLAFPIHLFSLQSQSGQCAWVSNVLLKSKNYRIQFFNQTWPFEKSSILTALTDNNLYNYVSIQLAFVFLAKLYYLYSLVFLFATKALEKRKIRLVSKTTFYLLYYCLSNLFDIFDETSAKRRALY